MINQTRKLNLGVVPELCHPVKGLALRQTEVQLILYVPIKRLTSWGNQKLSLIGYSGSLCPHDVFHD